MQAAIVHLSVAIMIIRALPALHRPTPPRMRRCRFVRAHSVAGLTIAVLRQPANAEIVTEINGQAHKYRLIAWSVQISVVADIARAPVDTRLAPVCPRLPLRRPIHIARSQETRVGPEWVMEWKIMWSAH